MNEPPILSATPPVLSTEDSITYELTRWDLFVNSMTVIFRNRMVQIIMAVAFVINGAVILLPKIGTASPLELGLSAVSLVVGITVTVLFFQTLMAVAIAYFMKQNGVVGKHTLLVTSTGLVERTELTTPLHKWPSVIRVMTLFGYIYIYVGEQNSHQIPRHVLDPQALESFMAKLRAHCPQLSR